MYVEFKNSMHCNSDWMAKRTSRYAVMRIADATALLNVLLWILGIGIIIILIAIHMFFSQKDYGQILIWTGSQKDRNCTIPYNVI